MKLFRIVRPAASALFVFAPLSAQAEVRTPFTPPLDVMKVTPNATAPAGTLPRYLLNALPSGRKAVEQGDSSDQRVIPAGAERSLTFGELTGQYVDIRTEYRGEDGGQYGPAFTRAIAKAIASDKTVLCPPGRWGVTTTIQVPRGFKMWAEGCTIIQYVPDLFKMDISGASGVAQETGGFNWFGATFINALGDTDWKDARAFRFIANNASSTSHNDFVELTFHSYYAAYDLNSNIGAGSMAYGWNWTRFTNNTFLSTTRPARYGWIMNSSGTGMIFQGTKGALLNLDGNNAYVKLLGDVSTQQSSQGDILFTGGHLGGPIYAAGPRPNITAAFDISDSIGYRSNISITNTQADAGVTQMIIGGATDRPMEWINTCSGNNFGGDFNAAGDMPVAKRSRICGLGVDEFREGKVVRTTLLAQQTINLWDIVLKQNSGTRVRVDCGGMVGGLTGGASTAEWLIVRQESMRPPVQTIAPTATDAFPAPTATVSGDTLSIALSFRPYLPDTEIDCQITAVSGTKRVLRR